MQSGDRERRLHGNSGLILVWTVMGCLLGVLLQAAFSAAGFGSGFILSESSEVATMIAGYIIVGIIVLSGIVKAFLEPLPDESSDKSHLPATEPRAPHLVTRHLLRRQQEARVEEHDQV
ncbi:MAG TPA: hypothetical protein VFN64_05695 [Burkholderiaceae bacterium]|nr:hypothetical protein [Burkholderiaceae bacterium]